LNRNRLILTIFFSLSILVKINAQFNCGPNISNNLVDLSYSEYATITDTVIIPPFGLDECCNQAPNINCTNFDITLNPNAVALQFTIIGLAGNTTVYYMNCNTSYSLNDNICIVGNGSQVYSLCTDLTSNFVVQITSIGPTIPIQNYILRENCNAQITVNGLIENSISWNSISPGIQGSYNYLLNCDSCTSVILTPTPLLPPVITYSVCGTTPTTTCSLGGQYCDTFTVSIGEAITFSIPPFITACYPAITATINSTITTLSGNPGPINYYWFDPLQNPIINNSSSLTVNQSGTYYFVISDTTDCKYESADSC